VACWSRKVRYSWTPATADADDHAERVSGRSAGSGADLKDTRTLAITISGGSGIGQPTLGSRGNNAILGDCHAPIAHLV
jgi:hypothetical protein